MQCLRGRKGGEGGIIFQNPGVKKVISQIEKLRASVFFIYYRAASKLFKV